jgi:hypothetical protein
VLLLGLPAEILNSSLKERQSRRPHERKHTWLHDLEDRVNGWPDGVLLVGFGIAGALIYSQLDPSLGFNSRSLLLIGALAAALVIATGVTEAVRIPFLRARHQVQPHLRMFPRAFIMAVPLVVLSRITGFNPGFIFGITCGLAVEGTLRDEDEGLSIGFAFVVLLAMGSVAWLLWIPASHAATGNDPSGVAVLVDTFLATLWVTGLQVVLFGMLPLKYLYGEKVLEWSRAGWFAIYFTAMFLFTQTLLHPSAGTWGGFSGGTLVFLGGVGGVLLAGSVVFWLWTQGQQRSVATATGSDSEVPPADERMLV